MGYAGLLLVFIAGSGTNENDEAHRAACGQGTGDDPQAVIEHRLGVHQRELYFTHHCGSMRRTAAVLTMREA